MSLGLAANGFIVMYWPDAALKPLTIMRLARGPFVSLALASDGDYYCPFCQELETEFTCNRDDGSPEHGWCRNCQVILVATDWKTFRFPH